MSTSAQRRLRLAGILLEKLLRPHDDGCVPEEGVYRRIARETGVLGRIAVAMDTYERQVIRGERDAATPTPTPMEGRATPDDGATA